MKTKQKSIDQHTRSAVQFPRGAFEKKATTMKKVMVGNVLVIFVSLAMVQALASPPSIGIATAKGSFRVDDSYVAGNATLFEGAAVETGVNSGELNLSKTRVTIGADTRSRVFVDRLILDRGKVQWAGTGFRALVGELQVVGADGTSKALVSRNGETIQVASISGTVNVLSSNGEMVMAVAAGNAYAFEADPQGASPGSAPKDKAKQASNAKHAGLSTAAKTWITIGSLGAAGGTAATIAYRETRSR
ncbi:MAG TPA: hypothetical protein VGL53_14445 [Bryobacteraceae bacterium]